jgi:WD40 repeat protein
MALSPDGKTLALLAAEGGTELWDLDAGKAKTLPNPIGEESGGGHVAYSNGGRSLAVSYGHVVIVWAVPDGKESARILYEGGSVNMLFTDADLTLLVQVLVSSGNVNRLPLYNPTFDRWDVASGRPLSSVVFRGIGTVAAISPDGRFGINWPVGADRVVVYNLASRAKVTDVKGTGDFIFSDDGSTLVSRQASGISIFELPSGTELKHFDVAPPHSNSCALGISRAPRPRLLAVGRHPAPYLASLISLDTGKVLGVVECGPPGTICERVRLSNDGRTLVTGTYPWSTRDQPALPWMKIWRLPETW